MATSNSSLKAYHFADERPAPGNNFYRLKIISQTGTFSYSKIIAVRDDTDASITLFPNPAASLLQVQTSSQPGTIQLEIQDMMGRVLQKQTIVSAGPRMATSVDIENLRSGIYQVVIKNGGTFYAARFTKQ
ncbi:T9SS type A sorting domain-containing protein [Flaviaesturariibacter flavus]|uniref:T9SS type A sorting domain-containing protein n=1 Tax=Flaviaesturariibacter flavus TaxID=2502780 RepID=UPI0014051A90|nr:T9SS type A sorting domain-containing protein [Flaviaesturariibacter flavus]